MSEYFIYVICTILYVSFIGLICFSEDAETGTLPLRSPRPSKKDPKT